MLRLESGGDLPHADKNGRLKQTLLLRMKFVMLAADMLRWWVKLGKRRWRGEVGENESLTSSPPPSA